ncbi:MAG: MaoC/PaaZ C-terminal domain-containing protein [Acidimicrobiia bacterium]|nr:MaoC/PaaZ C-terminal domain-containing protein [Acidimicrobiia bacterium]
MRFSEVELGDDLPEETQDITMERVQLFVKTVGMNFPRFTDHEFARKEGLPGAIVPGIMSQGLLAAMIHRWAPGSHVRKIDTVFRAPIVVGTSVKMTGAVTDLDDDAHTVEIDITVVSENGATNVLGTAVVELEP